MKSTTKVGFVSGALKALVVLLGAALLTACNDDSHADLATYVKEVKARPPARIPPLPEFKTYETYKYSVQNMRDPFQIVSRDVELVDNKIQQKKKTGPHPDLTRNKEALEKFPLDTLKFVGQIEVKGKTWGIVTAPDGLVHRVKVGNYLGQNNGKIVSISDTRIDIVELVSDGDGGWVERNASLTIKD